MYVFHKKKLCIDCEWTFHCARILKFLSIAVDKNLVVPPKSCFMRRYQYLTEAIFLIKKKPIAWGLGAAEHKNAFYNCIQSQGHEGDCKDGEILGRD